MQNSLFRQAAGIKRRFLNVIWTKKRRGTSLATVNTHREDHQHNKGLKNARTRARKVCRVGLGSTLSDVYDKSERAKKLHTGCNKCYLAINLDVDLCDGVLM